MFINFSNHESLNWSEAQIKQAQEYGDIIDLPFPAISPLFTEKQIWNLAAEYTERIVRMHPVAVMCQGEFTFCFAVVSQLLSKDIKVLAACTERKVKESVESTLKVSVFEFIGFREYKLL